MPPLCRSLAFGGSVQTQQHAKTRDFEKIKFNKSIGLKISRTSRIVFNRHCLWRLSPAGAFALLQRTKRSFGRVCRRAVLIQTYTPKRKTPAFGEGLSFGRTRRIRTADLYHVKADWPHQDTRGRPESSSITRPDQGSCDDHWWKFLSRPASRGTRRFDQAGRK